MANCENSSDHVADCQRRLITRNECRDRSQRHTGKGRDAYEEDRRDADDGQRDGTVAAGWWQGREKDAPVATCVHGRLRHAGIEVRCNACTESATRRKVSIDGSKCCFAILRASSRVPYSSKRELAVLIGPGERRLPRSPRTPIVPFAREKQNAPASRGVRCGCDQLAALMTLSG